MVTALTVYSTNTAAATTTTANTLVTGTGAGSTNTLTTLCGTSTGYSEIYAQGTAGAWAAGAASVVNTPSGHGFLLDSALSLVGQQMQAGNWTVTFRGKISVGTATADILCNAYVYDSGANSYTRIGSTMVLTAQAFTTSSTNYVFAAAAQPAQAFLVNQKLYFDVWLNITSNSSGSGAATISIVEAISSTQGNVNSFLVVTPGYASSVSVTMQITNAGLNLIAAGKAGTDDPTISYVAIGTGNTAPTVNDTKLVAEAFRKAVTTYTAGGQVGEMLIDMYLSDSDAVGVNIAEVGFFGGNAATATPNTGVLYARGLFSHSSKTNTESIQFHLDDFSTL